MLSESQLYRYFDDHNVSSDAVQYILNTRNSQPSRMVGTHARNNVCSWFYSEKMERTISTESRTAERAFVVLSEFDRNVFEIWDQPEPVIIQKNNSKGQRRNSSYTADFLILDKDGPCVVEVKDVATITKLVAAKAEDWVKRYDGSIDYLPAKRVFEKIGLGFRVFVASNDLRFRVLNQELLLRTRTMGSPCIVEDDLSNAFEESFCWTLYDLRERMKLNDYTSIIQCIDEGKLFFECDTEMLSEPRGCYLVKRKDLLKYVSEFRGPKIYHDSLLSAIEVVRMPPTAYAESALERLKRIGSHENGRSVRRWRALVKKGGREGWSEFQSLIPKWFFSGNRRRKVNELVEEFLYKYIIEDHAASPGLSDYRSYIRYRVRAQEEHPAYPPAARTTFIRRLQVLSERVALIREGKRKANAVAAPSNPLLRQLKAELAWQRAAVDHYLADIYLVFFDSEECPHVMRPWLTVMIDLATGCTLAFSISFQNPSRRSVAKVMRDCVRRHSMLPREIIVDRGSDFRSVYFSALLAHSKMELVLRPSSHSRYGGEVEGLFGEFKKQWLSQRPGNTTDFKNARGVDGKLQPKKLAVLTPYDFYREFETFISWRDSCPKSASISAPRNILARHMREFPFIGVRQEFNSEYAIATAVDGRNYKIDFQRGLHIGGIWYWSPELNELKAKKNSVEVRCDPENPHVVYALIGNRWVPCYSSRINRYSALDPISQWVDGLIVLDAFSARQKVKAQADEEVVRIIRSMTESRQQHGKSQIAVLSPVDESQEYEEDSVFQLLKDADIQTLEVEDWEVKHVW
ncbi:Mu transposase C-terminal domain-containing protein [Cellvibrio polysaccharolyticus]|nr:Mu transposase C-terminal domain-containing protein [Cellvibrio polysaccharolyticus]